MKNALLFFVALCGLFASAQKNFATNNEFVKPRIRVIMDNDFSGDPDGLFALAHLALSPSVEIRGVIGSHLKPGDPFDNSNQTATNAVSQAKQLLEIMGMDKKFGLYEGSNVGLSDIKTPKPSAASKAIIDEALKDDKRPLYVLCGAGLTDVASALLQEPKIAEKLTIVWIGGPEYPELASPPPGYTPLEYNLGIDIFAAQVVFNESNVKLWQLPRNAYRQTLCSYAELLTGVKPKGKLGNYLASALENLMKRVQGVNFHIGETYILGDSPLVLLTALQSSFEAAPSSSSFVVRQAPTINKDGHYETNVNGRNISVYKTLDVRLILSDLFAKLEITQKNK